MSFVDSQPTPKKSGPPRKAATKTAASDRPLVMSAQEKRDLILAHAANRQPTDHVQQLSLLAGVVICTLAIGVGWIYSVRKSVAQVFPQVQNSIDSANQGSDNAAWQAYLLKQQMQVGADNMLKQVDEIAGQQVSGDLGQALNKGMDAMGSTSTQAATTTQAKAASQVGSASVKAGIIKQIDKVTLPTGLKQDR